MKMKINAVRRSRTLLLGLAMTALALVAARAQVIQTWTYSSTFNEASTAVGMGNYMWVGDNEDEILRLYLRYPTNGCAAPVHTVSVRNNLNLSPTNPECDIEASTTGYHTNGQQIIYWLCSHSNSKN